MAFNIAFTVPLVRKHFFIQYVQLAGISLSGQMKHFGSQIIYMGYMKSHESAYLPFHNTYVICSGFIYNRPACNFFPDVDIHYILCSLLMISNYTFSLRWAAGDLTLYPMTFQMSI